MVPSVLAASISAVIALGVCLHGVASQAPAGMVAGAAMPGTMESTFTIPFSEFDASAASSCGTTFTGCTGTLQDGCSNCVPHEINGTITVIDDCTFRVQGWQFDGQGPAVEWWGSKQSGAVIDFPYPATALKIGELGAPGAYQQGSLHDGDSDVVVRLGLDSSGAQIELSEDLNHISVWCEDYMVDFGNAALMCEEEDTADSLVPGPPPATPPAATPATPPATPAATPPATPTAGTGAESSEVAEPSAVAPMHGVHALGVTAAFGTLALALL